jgi:hypothetical protein
MTTSQEMDAQFGDSEIERRLKDLERKIEAYEQGGFDTFRQFGYLQLGDALPRLDKDGMQLVGIDSGDVLNTTPDGARIKWMYDTLNGAVLADIVGDYSSPGSNTFPHLNMRTMWYSADANADAATKLGVWDVVNSRWQTLLSLQAGAIGALKQFNMSFDASGTLTVGAYGDGVDANNFEFKVLRTGTYSHVALQGDATVKTIASGVITITSSYHRIDTEGAAATDDLVTINGGATGQYLTLRALWDTRDVVVKDGTGNLQLEGDMTLNNAYDTITLIYDEHHAAWLEVARSNNGA